MFKADKVTGNIRLVQGDSGTLYVHNIPTDRNYEVYFAIRNSNRILIGFELMVQSNYQSVVPFAIPAELTDLLTVPLGEETEDYKYYIKRCYKALGLEDTLQIGNLPIGENIMTVIAKGAEGTND